MTTTRTLDEYAKKIEAITRKSRSETGLQIKLEGILSELLTQYDIAYEPSVNETLKAQGLSQVDSTRPDSLFGHVVLDYKAPGLLSTAKQFHNAKLQIEDYLNKVMRGRDLGRYAWSTDDWYQIIPNTHYENTLDEEAFAEKYSLAYSYFSNYRQLLEGRSTYKRYQKHLPFYVIYCVGSYSFSKWKVAWMEQQDPASFRCAVVSDNPDSRVPNKRIVPDHKLYFADVGSRTEAHYLAAYLNSRPVREWLGGFLHGKQIGTTVFEFMRVPKFDETSDIHRRLAAISLEAHSKRANSAEARYLSQEREDELAALVTEVAARKVKR